MLGYRSNVVTVLRFRITLALLIAAISSAAASCSAQSAESPNQPSSTACVAQRGEADLSQFLEDPCTEDGQSLSHFRAALSASDRSAFEHALGPVTILVPDNSAFERFAKRNEISIDALLNDTTLLNDLINDHVIAGEINLSSSANRVEKLITSSGNSMTKTLDDFGVKFHFCENEIASVVYAPVDIQEGQVIVIDRVVVNQSAC